MTTFNESVHQINKLLNQVSFSSFGEELLSQEGFNFWVKQAQKVKSVGKCIYFVGNGASASMASHFSADIQKNAKIRTQVFTDVALITALANDLSYENVYAEPLCRQCIRGDMLVAISSSGNSPNIVKACSVAKEKGAFVVTLSAMQEKNKISQLGDLNIYLSADTYGLAETCHSAILHYWTDLLVEAD